MAEPELVDNPVSDAAPDVPLEPEIVDEAVPPSAPETAVPTAGTLMVQTYHVSLWTTPVSYVCLRCPAKDFTHGAVCTHVTTAHGEEPIPTPLAADYLARNPFVMAMVGEEAPAEEVGQEAVPPAPDDESPAVETAP